MKTRAERDRAIAEAMARAEHMAIHGTREERSGIFNPTPLVQPEPKPPAEPRRKPQPAPAG